MNFSQDGDPVAQVAEHILADYLATRMEEKFPHSLSKRRSSKQPDELSPFMYERVCTLPSPATLTFSVTQLLWIRVGRGRTGRGIAGHRNQPVWHDSFCVTGKVRAPF